jgi:hypothetical protein
MERLSDELLARLRVGNKPRQLSAENNAALEEAAEALGVVKRQGVYDYDQNGCRNRVIDLLDANYPGWRGWSVPETEGKAVNHV